MFGRSLVINRCLGQQNLTQMMLAAAVTVILVLGASPAPAHGQSQGDQSQTQPQNGDSGKPKQEVPPDAGGPSGSIGPYTIPKKNPDEAPPPPPPPTAKPVEGMPDYSIKLNVPLVNVDVLVTTKNGQFVPGLKKDNFRLFEDGAQQQITSFNV